MDDPIRALLQGGVLQPSRFPVTSRYHRVATAELQRPDGTSIVYLRRRFVPPPGRFAVIGVHVVVAGDRIDNVAARYVGDPELFWQLCDANGALRPADLVATPGQRLVVTLPEGIPLPPHA